MGRRPLSPGSGTRIGHRIGRGDGRAGVLSLALASECSAYDCEFVWLAQNLGLPLVTADRKVLAAFPDTASTPEGFLAT